EAYSCPLWLCSAVCAAPGLFYDAARKIISQPIGNLTELLHGTNIGFLVQFAKRGLVWVLIFVNPALRHLPDVGRIDVFRTFGPSSNKNEPRIVEHHHAGAGAIGQWFVGRH